MHNWGQVQSAAFGVRFLFFFFFVADDAPWPRHNQIEILKIYLSLCLHALPARWIVSGPVHFLFMGPTVRADLWFIVQRTLLAAHNAPRMPRVALGAGGAGTRTGQTVHGRPFHSAGMQCHCCLLVAGQRGKHQIRLHSTQLNLSPYPISVGTITMQY